MSDKFYVLVTKEGLTSTRVARAYDTIEEATETAASYMKSKPEAVFFVLESVRRLEYPTPPLVITEIK